MSSKISTPNAYQSAAVVKPSPLKTSWEKKRHDIISRNTNNKILRYQFQNILNIVMNATAMVKGQGCQESGAKYSVLLPDRFLCLFSLMCTVLLENFAERNPNSLMFSATVQFFGSFVFCHLTICCSVAEVLSS